MRDKIIEVMARGIAPKHWGNNRAGGLWKDEIWDQQMELHRRWPEDGNFFIRECFELAEVALTALEQSGFRIVEKDESRSVFAGVARNITECDEIGHDWVRDGQMARCARDDCDYVRMPQGDERELTDQEAE